MAIMQRHLNKIKDFSTITTPVEAVVFDYNGHTYKFAGNFAPLNQILGMFRYGNLKRSTKESLVVDKPIITEKENNIKKERAKQFVLNLPKFSPNESWGKPGSMERSQVEKIFSTISGGASIQAKFDDIIGRSNFDTNMRAPRRIISTLIFLESLSAVIHSFTESSAGFVLEGFLAAMFSGKQVVDPDDGSKPIEDIIAFSTIKGVGEVPVSLKLLKKDGTIEGSFTNLVEALNKYPEMLYIVTRKLGDEIQIQQFAITRDNVIELLTSGKQEKGKYELFGSGDKPLVYPGKRDKKLSADLLAKYDRRLLKYKNNVVKQVEELKKLYAAAEWPVRYELLKNTYGYSAQKRDALAAEYEKAKKEKEARLKQQDTQATQPGEETQPVENNPELAEEGLVKLTIEEQRELWKNHLLTEAQSGQGRGWSISVTEIVPDTKKGTGISSDISGFKIIGNLPVSPDRIVAVAEKYMDRLGGSIEEIFKATKNLSDDIDGYFTYGDRSDAITAGDGAIKNSEIIGQEMKTQVAQDKTAPAQRNESLNADAQVITEKEGKRIALFPGKFKPPHRGHFDYVNKIAKRPDVDEVVIMISPVDYPEVSNAQSLRIWEEYLENGEPNITAKIADYRSPVQAVYEFVADPESASDGDTVLLVKSSKDVGDTRFDRAQSYAERNNPGVNVEDIVEDPVQSKDGIVYSARDMRKALVDGDKETFLSYAPPSIDGESLWNSLVSPSKRLNSFIDDSIDEISTMAAGDVSGGGAIGFGPPNTYNPYKKRSKTSRPKVRRAKRQRRR
jgi:nicotinamide mononucleotide adenylyltransferase